MRTSALEPVAMYALDDDTEFREGVQPTRDLPGGFWPIRVYYPNLGILDSRGSLGTDRVGVRPSRKSQEKYPRDIV